MKSWKVKKLSTALRQSLDDLKKVERKKKTYRVDMNYWHQPNSHCAVCLAGARMVGLGLKPEQHGSAFRGDVIYGRCEAPPDQHTEDLLVAMDFLRQGEVTLAARTARTARNVDLNRFDRKIPLYRRTGPGHKKWWAAMRQLQKDLEKAGL